MVAFHDFWSKSMKTKEKHWFLIVFLCFSSILGDFSENHEMSPSPDKKNHRKTSDEKKSSKLKQHFQKLTPSEVCTPRVQVSAELDEM